MALYLLKHATLMETTMLSYEMWQRKLILIYFGTTQQKLFILIQVIDILNKFNN